LKEYYVGDELLVMDRALQDEFKEMTPTILVIKTDIPYVNLSFQVRSQIMTVKTKIATPG
jgi:hypothetical protein